MGDDCGDCLFPNARKVHFMLEGLRAPDRCLRENCRAAWSTPVWSLTVCCLQEEHPNPTAFHKKKKSLNLYVLLPGKWSLKTLMRVLEAAAVSEGSRYWNETKFKQRLIFDGHHHLFWKDTPQCSVAVFPQVMLLLPWLFSTVTGDFSLQWRWNPSPCFLGPGRMMTRFCKV